MSSSSSIDDISYSIGEVDGDIRKTRVIHLNVPKTSRVIFQSQSLEVAGPKLWYDLPIQLCQESDLDNFKKMLKTLLFKRAHALYVIIYCFILMLLLSGIGYYCYRFYRYTHVINLT